MSAYGKLWEQVAELRRRILEAVPGACVDTLQRARVSVEAHGRTSDVAQLLEDWAYLDGKMANLPE